MIMFSQEPTTMGLYARKSMNTGGPLWMDTVRLHEATKWSTAVGSSGASISSLGRTLVAEPVSIPIQLFLAQS